MKLCECGCGEPAPIAKRNRTKGNWEKGEPLKYIHGHNGRGRGCRTKTGALYVVDTTTGCWVWSFCKDKKGYGVLRKNGKLLKAHRFFYEKYKGVIPQNLQIDHLCRNTSCVNPSHLEAVTGAVNSQRGSNAKLTPEKVTMIKRDLSKGTTQRSVAREFNVSPGTINNIARGISWT